MVKFNVKNLAIISFLGILLIGVMGIVYAQQALPKGGDSFETAVKLAPANYQGGSLESKEVEYFFLEGIKPGQEVKIKGSFTAANTDMGAFAILDFYDGDRVKLVEGYGEAYETPALITISWLPNADKASYKYYIRTGSDIWKIASYSLDISLVNRYDAGSQTDAGDSFEKAMSIATGNYTAYLSGEEGTDAKDIYKVGIKKDEKLTVKVTPPSTASPSLKIYNSNRQVLKEVFASNAGAIVQASLTATKGEDLFVEVSCDRWCSKNIANYTLNIAIQPPAEAGAPAEEEIAPGEVPSEEIVSPGEEVAPGPEAVGAEEGEPAKKGSNLMLILGIIAGIVVVGIVAYFLLKKKKK